MQQDDYRERLAHDVAKWRGDGIITEPQERAILARIGAGRPGAVGALRLGWLVTAISVIGAITLAAGVVLLFAANWERMPDWFRTALMLVSMLAAYAAGYALMYRFEMQRMGSAFLLLGALLYEAGVFLLAQIYNMPVDSPPLWLLAAAGVFPLAYLFESRIVLLVAIANATAWVIAEMVNRYPDSPESESALIVVGVFGVALYAFGRLHTLRRWTAHFSDVYVFAGLLITMGLVYVFTFDEIWDEIIDSGAESYAAPTIVYVAIGIAAALVAAQWLPRRRQVEAHIDTAGQTALLVLAAIVATWPAWNGYAVAFNAAFFAIAAAIVARGYVRGDERYVNFGLAAVGLGLLTRYVDVFWSLLAGSVFFIIGGIVLLAVAFGIERVRRELLRGMDGDDAPAPTLPPTEAPA